ncbi:Uma2 family endonuclease [Sorangium sp. So ce1036]|uniref:Uma2 family endonuclease n=1 Tax=Sorangium sp. So ce1036 TaxID=3133328 RepID=UPI003F120380
MAGAAAQRDPESPVVDRPDISGLVVEDDTPVDNLPSEKQQRLLTESLYTSWSGPPPDESGGPRPFLAAANVGLFSSVKRPPLVPDFFLSLDVVPAEPRWAKENRTYLFWEFGKPPELVIEVVSNREGEELGRKRRGYAGMRIPHYVVYDPARHLGEAALHAFELRGDLYVPIQPWFELLGLGLVEWDGEFEGMSGPWLRWRDQDGELLLTGAERAESERERAESERKRAEGERERAEGERKRAEEAELRAQRLAARLRALGVDPDADT